MVDRSKIRATSKRPRLAPFNAFEKIARSFVEISSRPKPEQRIPPDLVLPEAHIRWGKAADYDIEDFQSEIQSRGFSVTDGGEEADRKRVQISEEGRTWTDWRVENPDDPDQYVILRTVNDWASSAPPITLWAGPAGDRRKYEVSGAQFVWHLDPASGLPDGSTEEEGSGQEPPAPPALDEL